MRIDTHPQIDRELCGEPVLVEERRAEVVLTTRQRMAVDAQGLVHGGFVFGAADHAAMLAVNDPNVVLGSAEARFLAPVVVGEAVALAATVESEEGRKRIVRVEGRVGTRPVLRAILTCFVLDRHVLETLE